MGWYLGAYALVRLSCGPPFSHMWDLPLSFANPKFDIHPTVTHRWIEILKIWCLRKLFNLRAIDKGVRMNLTELKFCTQVPFGSFDSCHDPSCDHALREASLEACISWWSWYTFQKKVTLNLIKAKLLLESFQLNKRGATFPWHDYVYKITKVH